MDDVEGEAIVTATAESPLVVGPLRIATSDVIVRTNCEDFAAVATTVFSDLARGAGAPPAARTVVFDTIRETGPEVQWSVHRDGEPCELQLRTDAVMVHQQWEFNRLAIESHRCSIHAAAVSIDGLGVVLAGRSHSGKTTLAGWLVAHHGADYVADEVSAIQVAAVQASTSSGQLRVRPFPRPLGMRADSPLARTAGPASAATRGFMPDERLVPVAELGGAVASGAVPVGLLVFPRFDADSPLTVTTVDAPHALVRLAELTPGLAGHGRPVFERLHRLVASTPAIEVRYDDVRRAATTVLAELAAAVAGRR